MLQIRILQISKKIKTTLLLVSSWSSYKSAPSTDTTVPSAVFAASPPQDAEEEAPISTDGRRKILGLRFCQTQSGQKSATRNHP